MHPFGICSGFPVPHGGRFRSALLSSRTVGFPESGWRWQPQTSLPLSIVRNGLDGSQLIAGKQAARFLAMVRNGLCPENGNGTFLP